MFRDYFEPDLNFVITENQDPSQDKAILGKLRGCFFVPNGKSRNNRFYSRGLWEKVLSSPEVKEKLKNKRMFGTISHTQNLDDMALLEGKVSHIVTDLRIEGDKGIGEAEILNTPAGRILYTMLKAGSKLFVSSRANGDFQGEQEGVPAVNPATYQLIGFDVVGDPGFLQANPRLAESLEALLKSDTKEESNSSADAQEDKQMKEVLEAISKENATLKIDLGNAMKSNAELKEANEKLMKELEALKAAPDTTNEALKAFESLGTPEEINKALDLMEARVNEMQERLVAYKDLGEPSEIQEAFDKSRKLIEDYRKIGSVEEINRALDRSIKVVEAFKELGTPVEVNEALEKAAKVIAQYREFGKPEEIREAFDRIERHMRAFKEEKKKNEGQAPVAPAPVAPVAPAPVASAPKVESAPVAPVASAPKVESAPVAPAPVTEASKVESKGPVATTFIKKGVNKVIEPTIEKSSLFTKSRGERLMEELCK